MRSGSELRPVFSVFPSVSSVPSVVNPIPSGPAYETKRTPAPGTSRPIGHARSPDESNDWSAASASFGETTTIKPQPMFRNSYGSSPESPARSARNRNRGGGVHDDSRISPPTPVLL